MNSATTAWDRAWADAQTYLQSIPHELVNTRTFRPHVLRVGQLDAELLDIELVQLLRQPLSTALGLIKVRASLYPLFRSSDFFERQDSVQPSTMSSLYCSN
jgi:hypothetical protein